MVSSSSTSLPSSSRWHSGTSCSERPELTRQRHGDGCNWKDGGGLVVGGAGALGAAMADLYAEHGATVVVADLETGSSPHPAVPVDITDEVDVRRAVAEDTELVGGSIDILVNSAGILSEAPVASMPLDLWQETIDVDLTGVFLPCRGVVPAMIERRWGRIINVTSPLGIKGGRTMAHYSAAKAGWSA